MLSGCVGKSIKLLLEKLEVSFLLEMEDPPGHVPLPVVHEPVNVGLQKVPDFPFRLHFIL